MFSALMKHNSVENEFNLEEHLSTNFPEFRLNAEDSKDSNGEDLGYRKRLIVNTIS